MEKKQITNEEVLSKIEGSYDQLEDKRAASLEEFLLMQDIRDKAQTKERERLVKKYGENDPRVKKINSRINYTTNFTPLLDTYIDYVRRKLPPIEKNSWRVHGRLLKADTFTPVEGLTVSLFTGDGQWVRQLGYDCTDSKGLYALTYDSKKIADKTLSGQDKSTFKTDLQTKSIASNLFLTVTDTKREIIHTEKEAVVAAQGQIVYRDIILGKEPCQPPSGDKDSKPTEPNGDRPPGSKDYTPGKDDEDGSGQPPAPIDKAWTVRGRVLDNANKPVRGLIVILFDKEHLYDAKLGNVVTKEEGSFEFKFKAESYPDLIKKNPEIFLRVIDAKGKSLYTTRKAIYFEVGKEAAFNIKIS